MCTITNAVVPILLTVVCFAGSALAFLDVATDDKLSEWWGGMGIALSVSSAISFKLICHWLRYKDKATEENE